MKDYLSQIKSQENYLEIVSIADKPEDKYTFEYDYLIDVATVKVLNQLKINDLNIVNDTADYLDNNNLNNSNLTDEQFISFYPYHPDYKQITCTWHSDPLVVSLLSYLVRVAVTKYVYTNKEDQIIVLLNKYNLLAKRIDELEFKNSPLSKLDQYYNHVIEDYECKQNDGFSLMDIYVPAYDSNHHKIIQHIDQWFNNGNKLNYGIMLIHGDPGHGKTSLCQNIVYEYKQGNTYFQSEKLTNVLWFKLNSAHWNFEKNNIAYAFCEELHPYEEDLTNMTVQLEDCKNSIIILDAFDELITKMKESNKCKWKSFMDFYRYLYVIAKKYQIHFIITSRTNAIKDELEAIKKESIPCYRIEYLNETDQEQFANNLHSMEHYSLLVNKDYVKYFYDEKTKTNLLGIPVIFKLVMIKKYIPDLKMGTLNKVDLYEELFNSTTERNEGYIPGDVNEIKEKLMNLAYRIFINNDQQATYERLEDQGFNELVYSYYIDYNTKEIGFKHRSFYQHYLAYYLYNQIKHAETEEKAYHFLSSLLPRRLDNEELQLIHDVYELENEGEYNSEITHRYSIILEVLWRNEGVFYNEEITKPCYDQFNNAVVNAINIFTKGMHIENGNNVTLGINSSKITQTLRNYTLRGLHLSNLYFKRIDFSRMDLNHVDFSNTTCFFCKFNDSILRYVKFVETDLTGSRMINCEFNGAHFEKTIIDFVDFRGSNFKEFAFQWQVKYKNKEANNYELYNQGIQIGTYKGETIIGRALDFTKDSELVVITEQIIEYLPYNIERENIWSECTVRKALNGEGYKKGIVDQIKDSKVIKRISPVKIENDRIKAKEKGEDQSQKDRMYLLSIKEVKEYFIDDIDREATGIDRIRKDKENGGKLWVSSGGTSYWWLRSPGACGNYAAVVVTDGSVDSDGYSVYGTSSGVRPAFRLDFKSEI